MKYVPGLESRKTKTLPPKLSKLRDALKAEGLTDRDTCEKLLEYGIDIKPNGLAQAISGLRWLSAPCEIYLCYILGVDRAQAVEELGFAERDPQFIPGEIEEPIAEDSPTDPDPDQGVAESGQAQAGR